MKYAQLFLCWLFTVASFSFCVQNTSQGAAVATNATGGPQGQREVRTTAYIGSRHGAAKTANGSQLKSGHLNSAAADWSRFPLGTKLIYLWKRTKLMLWTITGRHWLGPIASISTCHRAEICIVGVFARSRLISLNQARMTGVLHSSKHESTCRTYERWSKC